MLFFNIATLTPVALLAVAALRGGVWVALALVWITVVTWAMDHLVARAAVRRAQGAEFPTGTRLALALGLAHPVLLALAVWAIGGPSGLGGWERAGLWAAFGLFFGQVGHPNAHELIHKPGRGARALGRLIYTTLLFGHHASAHLRVHHVHAATDADPNSAPRGQGFWRFAARAWAGSFVAGWRAESALRARAHTSQPWWRHPYAAHVGGALATMAAAAALAGAGGIAALLALAAYAQVQILLSDYVQHYGLRRALRDDGRPAPLGPQHSWNAPQFWSSAMMLNAPRHSDHHLAPTRPFPALRLDTDTMPVLPRALPVMAVVALWPPLWRRVMDPRVARWQSPGQGKGAN
ncbi:alkane 1-monooxygenase [Sediminimonas sp.]|uniref:alkane 1-monooxygenase n=1 Tax=Sediminimonas sp. TaxID=2823379 RepID=UPI0025F774B7|nr:alkane 1-monooxygenase [Sediminimonas sp.]